jgi:uncharacterized membrane protein
MNNRFKLVIDYVFIFGLLVSLLLTASGGGYYLLKEGNSIKNYHVFHNTAQLSLKGLNLSPKGIILIGIMILIFLQILRVVLIAFYYAKIHDYKFVFFSFFIVGIILLSFFLKL